MSYENSQFVEDIMDALKIDAPDDDGEYEGEYDVSACATLALHEIDRLQMRDKMLAKLERENVPETRSGKIKHAAELIKTARSLLRSAGANNAAEYVARALKSVDGAHRHARGLEAREAVTHG